MSYKMMMEQPNIHIVKKFIELKKIGWKHIMTVWGWNMSISHIGDDDAD